MRNIMTMLTLTKLWKAEQEKKNDTADLSDGTLVEPYPNHD